MTDRIQRVLDGELPRDRLTPAELAELDAYEEAMDSALAPLRAEEEPDVRADVMRRVEALPAYAPGREGLLRRWWSALWRPRSFSLTLRPAWGVAMAVLATVLVLSPWGASDQQQSVGGQVVAGEAGSGETASGEAAVLVHFRLEAPDASAVQLAGDFTGWEPRYTLNEVRDGVWSVVVPVEPGVHQYGFVVDGQRWRIDPFAPQVDDGFGGSNSRLDVLAPVERPL